MLFCFIFVIFCCVLSFVRDLQSKLIFGDAPVEPISTKFDSYFNIFGVMYRYEKRTDVHFEYLLVRGYSFNFILTCWNQIRSGWMNKYIICWNMSNRTFFCAYINYSTLGALGILFRRNIVQILGLITILMCYLLFLVCSSASEQFDFPLLLLYCPRKKETASFK